MYLEPAYPYYTADGEQRTHRASFLILLQSANRPVGPDNLKGVVRRVALRQLGQFMMGSANIGGRWHTISGLYGGDGLPRDVDEATFSAIPDTHLIPPSLYRQWAISPRGTEPERMVQWAHHLETISRRGYHPPQEETTT